jgi:hypothetical protein
MPAAAKKIEASDEQHIDEITYHPGEGDPVRTKWNGVEFRAYVPVKVSAKHTVIVPMPINQTLPDGTIVTKHVDKRIPMVELAKGNPRFSVNGEAPASNKPGSERVPSTSDEYRGYAISWIAKSTAASAMDARWEAEDSLREKCGCVDSDIAYLRPFFEARHSEVKAA